MNKVGICSFVLVLMIGLAFAADDWQDINPVDAGDNASLNNASLVPVTNDSGDGLEGDLPEPAPYVSPEEPPVSSGEGEFYNTNFYIALALGFVVLAIIGLFIYFLLRPPKNKWEK